MNCANPGSTCRQEMVLKAFQSVVSYLACHRRSLSDLEEQSYKFQVIFTLVHEVIKDKTKVPDDRFCHSGEYFFHVLVFCR